MNCANGFWLPLLEARRVPTAINVDGVEWERRKWNRLGRRTLRLGAKVAARRATAVVADSVAIADIWDEEFAMRPNFIPYGASIVEDDASDELEALGLPIGEYVLTVARLTPENNVELTIKALKAMDRRRPYVVVGSANYRSELQASIKRLALQPNVWWLGHVSNQRLLTQLWRHCAIYVHGHSVGGTNPGLLQALGAGAPTLAYDSVFNREVIGEADVFFDSPEALVRKLERWLDAPGERRAIAERGQVRVRDRYSWPDVCDRYLDLLERLATEGRRAHSPPD
jgi:glycosyltransferase involved in cell wall biosynthesis